MKRTTDANRADHAPPELPSEGTTIASREPILPATTTTIPISKLKLHPKNPRRGNVPAIKRSLELNRQYAPLVVQSSTMQVIRGNHTLKAARELGWSELAVYLIDVDDETALRIAIADNRTSDLAGYDSQELVQLLEELGELDGTAFEQADLDQLLEELATEMPLDEDEAPPLPGESTTRPGELIRLGEHLLLCADACEPSSYERT